MRTGASQFLQDERGAGMVEYALILFAVLLLGAAAIRKISPGINTAGDTTRRILSGEDVRVTGNSTGGAGGATAPSNGGIDPNGNGNEVAGSGAAGGSSNGNGGSVTGSSSQGGAGGAGGGGSSGAGGSGSGSSTSSGGMASLTGGGVLLGASGSNAFGGGGGGGLTLGSFSTESASGGGSSGGSGGRGGSSAGNGSAGGGGNSVFNSGSSGGSFGGSAGNALAALFGSSSATRAGSSAGSPSASGGAASTLEGRSSASSSQGEMPLGLLGASRSNEVNPPPGQGAVNGAGYSISANGERQMQALLAQARRNAGGKRPKGRCYHQVKIDIQEVGYGAIPKQTANAQLRPLPASDQGYAHDFADYMNHRGANGQTNAQSLGLQRLPITNPYDAPAGSIIVVRAGTPGTHNPVAGDIVVAGGNGTFYNDGNMGYRGSKNFPPGNNYVLGIYAPR